MKKRLISKSLLFAVCLSLSFMVYAVGNAHAQSQPQKKAPELIRIATYDIGGVGYIMYGFLQEAIAQKFGTKLRAIPIGTDLPRMQAVKDKQAEACGQGTDMYFAAEGLDRYAVKSWGPQPIRALWTGRQPGWVGIVRGDSGIKTVSDLKGKRLPWIPGSVFNIGHEAMLAFGKLTWNDVKKVQVSGFGAMTRALPEGKVDVIFANVTSPVAYEMESSPYKLGYIPFPAVDKEAWKRLQSVNPILSPYKACYGAGVSDKHPVECSTCPYPVTLAYDFLDDDMAYFITKATNESYALMAQKSEMMKRFWDLQTCLSLFENTKGFIFHPGSVRYFKEIGVWKPQWDKLQEKRIQRQKALKELWNKTVAEANSKGIKDSDFPQFWLAKRAEVFKEFLE